LGPGGFVEGVIGGSQSCHKDLRLSDCPGGAVDYRHGLARIIDKQLLAGAVVLAHDHIQLALPGSVVLTEPTVLVAVRMCGTVFLPEQEQGDVLEPELLVDSQPVGNAPQLGRHIRWWGKQQSFQSSVVQIGGQLRPAPWARRRYSPTVGRPTPQLVAIWRLLMSLPHLRRRTSLILRMDNLFAGI